MSLAEGEKKTVRVVRVGCAPPNVQPKRIVVRKPEENQPAGAKKRFFVVKNNKAVPQIIKPQMKRTTDEDSPEKLERIYKILRNANIESGNAERNASIPLHGKENKSQPATKRLKTIGARPTNAPQKVSARVRPMSPPKVSYPMAITPSQPQPLHQGVSQRTIRYGTPQQTVLHYPPNIVYRYAQPPPPQQNCILPLTPQSLSPEDQSSTSAAREASTPTPSVEAAIEFSRDFYTNSLDMLTKSPMSEDEYVYRITSLIFSGDMALKKSLSEELDELVIRYNPAWKRCARIACPQSRSPLFA